MKRVISLGAGRQSTALLLMAIEGTLDADAAIFADTGAEPKAVYRHVGRLIELAHAAGFPLFSTWTGDLREDVLHPKGKTQPSIPAYVAKPNGKRGKLARHCTRTYKIEAIRRELRRQLGLGPLGRTPRDVHVTSLIGIATDEPERVRTHADVEWITLEYPLIDLGMSTDDCIAYNLERGIVAPKSSCSFCPFHADSYWRHLRDSDPDGWAETVAFDHAIRTDTLRGVKHPAFLHASLVPLDEVELGDDPGAFGECATDVEAVCGVDL